MLLRRLLLTAFCILSSELAVQAATYYVDQAVGSDSNSGTSPTTPWKNAPGMTAYSGTGSVKAGDTVYFNSAQTWLTTGNWGLSIVGGVTYIGDTWPATGSRAIIRLNALPSNMYGVIDWQRDDPTFPTIFQGFDVDGNHIYSDGISINHAHYISPLMGAIKRVQNVIVHNIYSSQAAGTYAYGIIISNWGGASAEVDNVEILNSIVHDVSRDAICLYPSDVSAAAIIKNITVRGNEAYNTAQDPNFAAGFAGAGIVAKSYVQNAFIEYNYVHNVNGAGIMVSGNETNHYPGVGPTNIHIRYNVINNNSVVGAIRPYDQPSGADPMDIKVYGNIVYNDTAGGGFDISTDLGNSVSLIVDNNTFFNSPVTINNTKATFSVFEFKNNIVYYPGGTPITGSGHFTSSSNNLTTNPSFKNTASLPTGFIGTYGVNLAPNADGLSVVLGSPAIDAGTTLVSPYNGSVNSVTRPQGSAFDIGAYEFSSGSLPPLSPCDVNGDGNTNVADVQGEVNMALGIGSCTNPSGTCTVVSVQRVVNAALGGLCVSP